MILQLVKLDQDLYFLRRKIVKCYLFKSTSDHFCSLTIVGKPQILSLSKTIFTAVTSCGENVISNLGMDFP